MRISVCFPIRVDSPARSRARSRGTATASCPSPCRGSINQCGLTAVFRVTGMTPVWCMGPQGEFSSVAHEACQKVICSNRIRRNQLLLPVHAKGHVWQQKILTVCSSCCRNISPRLLFYSPNLAKISTHSAMSNYNLIQQQFWPKNTHQKVQLILTRILTLAFIFRLGLCRCSSIVWRAKPL